MTIRPLTIYLVPGRNSAGRLQVPAAGVLGNLAQMLVHCLPRGVRIALFDRREDPLVVDLAALWPPPG